MRHWVNVLGFAYLATGALALSPSVIAEEAKVWSGKAELGFLNTTGNSKTSSTNGKFNLVYDPEKWRQEFRLEILKAESEVEVNNQKETQETADRIYFLSKTDYKFGERSYAYGLLDYADETFTDKDYIGNFSLGYGRTFIKEKDTALSGEFGYGLRRYQLRDSVDAESEKVIRLAGKYASKVSDNANFSQELVAELGDDFDIYKSVSSLNVNINSSLALSLGYEATHTSELTPQAVLDGVKKTDGKTTINLVYNFL